YRGADILILDEPTSVLTPKETNELFSILKRMREEGKAIIFITHKLDEVFAISDRVTVLRKGKVIGKLKTSETNKKELARLMVGREVLFRLEREPVQKGKIVLEVIDLHALNDKGLPALKGVSFTIAEGEILGLAGVAGNGQKELVEVLTGLRKAEKGKVLIRGVDVTNASPRRIAELGVAHIPEERLKHGLVPNMSVAENLILKRYYKQPYCDKFFIDKKKVLKDAEELIDKFKIMTPSPMTPAKLLSGGNIQRLILARELAGSPDVIIAAHPTYGLDVGATEYIRKILLKERKRGSAILLVSEDLEEIMELSDRIAVMFEGEIMGILPAEKANLEDIGLMMAGAKRMGVVA
ncbi:MAG: heme ABC transporter ATP-binding protein, partial [Thermoproteota archaeon]